MAKPRLKLSLKKEHALEVTRIAIGSQKVVYVLTANKKLKYRLGSSAIAYIGTTKKGVLRIAQSTAAKAEEILGEHGIKKITARVMTCGVRKRVKTWVKLERALLLEFRSTYGEVPKFNSQGSHMQWTDELNYFSRSALAKSIERLGVPN